MNDGVQVWSHIDTRMVVWGEEEEQSDNGWKADGMVTVPVFFPFLGGGIYITKCKTLAPLCGHQWEKGVRACWVGGRVALERDRV